MGGGRPRSMCDERPRRPPDRTVCAGRRSCRARRAGRGHAPRLSDGELITLAVAQVLLGFHDERRWFRRCSPRPGWRAPVPLPAEAAGLPQACSKDAPAAAVPRRSGTGAAVPVVVRPAAADRRHPGAVRHLAGDGQALRPGRVRRLRLLRRHSRYYWGLRLYLIYHPGRDADHVVPGQPEDRRTRGRRRRCSTTPTDQLLRAGPDPDRPTRASPDGSSRTVTDAHRDCACSAPTAATRPTRHGNLGGIRQWIESVNDTLKGQLDLERHGGRTPRASTPASPSGCSPWPPRIWHNWTTGTTSKRSLIAYDH